MSKDAPGGAERSDQPAGDGRLDSWKEIAAFLKRDVTTVRRWKSAKAYPCTVMCTTPATRSTPIRKNSMTGGWDATTISTKPRQSTAGPPSLRRSFGEASWPGLRPHFL